MNLQLVKKALIDSGCKYFELASTFSNETRTFDVVF